MTKVVAIKCPECEYTVFSRAPHDFRRCFCGKIAIEGGFDYVRLLFPHDMDPPEFKKIDVYQTPMELFEDWNCSRNIYGRIPPVFQVKENENDK